MKAPRLNRRTVAAALAPVVLAAGTLAPVASAHTPAASQQTPAVSAQTVTATAQTASTDFGTRGFNLYNETDHEFTIGTTVGRGGGVEHGRVIKPHSVTHFEIPVVDPLGSTAVGFAANTMSGLRMTMEMRVNGFWSTDTSINGGPWQSGSSAHYGSDDSTPIDADPR